MDGRSAYRSTTAAPSYHSSPDHLAPSHMYARPQPPSDVASENFQWGEDAASTIAPDDSVSQLDRRFTGRRRMLGPRAMDHLDPNNAAAVPAAVAEEDDDYPRDEAVHRDYVPPELLEDDRSTVVPAATAPPSSRQSPSSAGVRAVNPSTAGGGPLSRARGESSGSPALVVPYAGAGAASSPSQDHYHGDDDDDASHPLVPGAAAGVRSSSAAPSTVTPYARPAKGYAALGGDDHDDFDDDDERDGGAYSAYARRRDADLEAKAGGAAGSAWQHHERAGSRDSAQGESVGAPSSARGVLGGFLSSLRGGGGGGGASTARDREGSFYTPNDLAFRPPSGSSFDLGNGKPGGSSYPPSASPYAARDHLPQLDKVPSLDVAGAHDRSASSLGAGYGASGARGESITPKPLWQRWLWDTTDAERRVWEHKRGVGMQRWPFASWGLAVVMSIVMIIELVRMNSYTGSPIQTKPSFNVMIGPSGAVLINLGARFAGCMKYISNVTDISWTCLENTNKATLSSADPTCTMSDICGFGGFDIVDGPGGPDQSFRFFVPIFLHAGVVHLLLNMLAQCTSSAQVERMMGTPRFLVVYFASGFFGFILGANFALVGLPSVGASGAIFGTHAALLVDLLAHWKIEYRPKRKLAFLIVEIIIGIGLGWVPGVDNFAHLGGFLVGLLTSILLFPIVHPSRTHKLVFVALRLVALPLVIVVFVVLTRNFYTGDPATACSWCRYLSCWPTSSNNHCKGTGLTTVTASSSTITSLVTILFSTFVLPLL
ncbi:hypothetical protein JCM9279_000028 [Rhodotorula babjevae]